MDTGFYLICEETEDFGLGVNLSYSPEEDDLQFSILIGCCVLAIGYKFSNDDEWY